MKDALLQLFERHTELALLISLSLSIIVALLGVIPSLFITAANILFFGFWQGTVISFLGEALGAAISFLLYRKGFKEVSQDKLMKFSSAQKLFNAKGREAFLLVLSLRLFPFVPSGLITFCAAIGKISFISFFIASSTGKIPALLLEAYSVNAVAKFNWQGKAILVAVSFLFLYFIFKRINTGK